MGKNSKFIYLTIIFFILSILILHRVGVKKNEVLLIEQNEIFAGVKLVQEKKTDESIYIFDKYRDSKYTKSYIYNLYYARALLEQGENSQAYLCYKYAYNINPKLLLNQTILDEINKNEVKDID